MCDIIVCPGHLYLILVWELNRNPTKMYYIYMYYINNIDIHVFNDTI